MMPAYFNMKELDSVEEKWANQSSNEGQDTHREKKKVQQSYPKKKKKNDD